MSTSSSGRARCGLEPQAAGWLLANADVGLALPHPSETFIAEDLDAEVHNATFHRLSTWGLIKRVGRAPDGRYIYRTEWSAYDWIDANVELGDRLPCGHRGLRNIPDGGYSCVNEGCSEEFPRAVASEVFGR